MKDELPDIADRAATFAGIRAVIAMRAAPEPAPQPIAWWHNCYGTVELSRVQRVGWKPLYDHPAKQPETKGAGDVQD